MSNKRFLLTNTSLERGKKGPEKNSFKMQGSKVK
jgi:hypothetical protein